MKLYLAAPYAQMKQMQDAALFFKASGHEVVAQWIHGNEEGMTLNDAAQMDLDDVDRADAVVSFTLPKGSMFSSGGRHVEFGYALAKGKLCVTIGERENIFHHLHHVKVCSSLQEALALL